MEQKGVYTSFLLDRQFHGQLRLAIELEFSALDAVIDNALRNDAWQPRALFVEDVPVLDERDVSGPQHRDDDDNDAAVSALDNVVDQMVAARIADAITAGTAQDINQLLQESDDFMAGPASSQSFVKLDNNNDHDDFDYHRAQ